MVFFTFELARWTPNPVELPSPGVFFTWCLFFLLAYVLSAIFLIFYLKRREDDDEVIEYYRDTTSGPVYETSVTRGQSRLGALAFFSAILITAVTALIDVDPIPIVGFAFIVLYKVGVVVYEISVYLHSLWNSF